jgi:pyruvate/2-oxoglutarate dehydrogenase complex dihydrolipoamide dehydrogenase (E3) component
VDLGKVNRRVKRLALAQSHDITASVTRAGARVMRGRGRLDGMQAIDGSRKVVVKAADGTEETLVADAVLIATGGHPRELDDARPDGERILNWTQVYDLTELPEELIVVGSGVTGAEFAGAYQALGSKVTLVSSRDRVLPGEDPDAAAVLEDVFRRRGMNVMARSRAESAKRVGDKVEVTPRRRPGHHRLALPDGGRRHPEHRGHGPGGGGRQGCATRAHLDRQGLPYLRSRACTRPVT